MASTADNNLDTIYDRCADRDCTCAMPAILSALTSLIKLCLSVSSQGRWNWCAMSLCFGRIATFWTKLPRCASSIRFCVVPLLSGLPRITHLRLNIECNVGITENFRLSVNWAAMQSLQHVKQCYMMKAYWPIEDAGVSSFWFIPQNFWVSQTGVTEQFCWSDSVQRLLYASATGSSLMIFKEVHNSLYSYYSHAKFQVRALSIK